MKNKCWIPWFIVLFLFGLTFLVHQPANSHQVYIFKQTEPSPRERHIYREPQHHTKQVGFLQSVDGQQTLPLYSRPSSTHKYRHNYFTRSLDLGIPIPVFHNQRNCTESLGCDELYDGNQVHLPGTFEPLTVHMYARDFCF